MMKTNNKMKPLARLIAASLAAGSMAGFGAQAFAATAAGTEITNIATVTYVSDGIEFTATSNEAIVTVAEVNSATIESDEALDAAPGQTVNFPHTLSNTGNAPDEYTLAAAATDGTVYTVFNDLDGDGEVDPGEPEITGPITLDAGESVNLIVALPIPATGVATGDTFDSTLTVTADSGEVVDDLTDGNGIDTFDGTVQDVATVIEGPVLVLSKSAVQDEAANTITYTLTVNNTGGAPATAVQIIDALPQYDSNVNGTIDALDTQLSLDGAVTSLGLVNTGDDTLGNTTTATDEGLTVGDLNENGLADDDALNIVFATDAELPANTEVSVTYTVTYDPSIPAGEEINNTFRVAFLDDEGTPQEVSSNETETLIPQVYGVLVDDTDDLELAGDEDETGPDNDDEEVVAAAAPGESVQFPLEVLNGGNGDDIFELEVDSIGTFPTGTTFTFFDATGSVVITDTGVLEPGELANIIVVANLPAGVSGDNSGNGFTTTVTATSTNDPASVADTSTLILDAITEATVDLANLTSGQGDTTDAGFNDDGTVNLQDEAPVVQLGADVGETVTFPLAVANESGGLDSFVLSADNVPDGWDVVFRDASGTPITATPILAANEVFEYTADVIVSSDPTEALGSSDRADDVDGIDTVDDGIEAIDTATEDNDVDYLIDFIVTSASNTAVTDTVTNSVDVTAVRDIDITETGQNQVQAGGNVDYGHVLENNGNETEEVTLTADNSDEDFTTTINVTDSNGDTVVLSSLVDGDTIQGEDANGDPVDIEVSIDSTTGDLVLTLEPGETVDFTTTVFAPSDETVGTVDVSTITATTDFETETTTDTTEVVEGLVRLAKTVARDAACDGIADEAFAETALSAVAPGECVVWNLVASNDSTEAVTEVEIADSIPDFTVAANADGSVTGAGLAILKYCTGQACAPTADAAGSYDAGTGIVTFDVGTLNAGEQATGQFTVEVE